MTSGSRSTSIGYNELTNILVNPANCSVGYNWTHASTGTKAPGELHYLSYIPYVDKLE